MLLRVLLFLESSCQDGGLPSLQKVARGGRGGKLTFPAYLLCHNLCNFSFSLRNCFEGIYLIFQIRKKNGVKETQVRFPGKEEVEESVSDPQTGTCPPRLYILH